MSLETALITFIRTFQEMSINATDANDRGGVNSAPRYTPAVAGLGMGSVLAARGAVTSPRVAIAKIPAAISPVAAAAVLPAANQVLARLQIPTPNVRGGFKDVPSKLVAMCSPSVCGWKSVERLARMPNSSSSRRQKWLVKMGSRSLMRLEGNPCRRTTC